MQVGPWWIDSYTVRLVGACTLALVWLGITAPRRRLTPPEFAVGIWALTLTVIAAGRAGYVWIHREYFAQNPADVLRLGRVGGLNGASAWGGGLLTATAWAALKGHRLHRLIDWLAPAALLVAVGAWSGCMHTGCAWGREASQPPPALQWLVTESPDLMRSIRPRYAVRTVGLTAALLGAGAALALGRRSNYALAIYLAVEAGASLLRGNPVPTVGSLRADTLVVALWAILVAVIAAQGHRDRAPGRPAPAPQT